jgi:hypothetical protein
MDDRTPEALPAEVARQPRETAANYDSFLLYVRLGPRRSLAKVAACTGRPIRHLERVSAKDRWRKRTLAFDAHIERQALAAIAKEALAVRRDELMAEGRA